MIHVGLKKILHGFQGIGIRCYIEIQGPTKKVFHRIAQEELLCGSSVAAHFKEYTMYTVGRTYETIIDRIGYNIVFVSKREGIVYHTVKLVGTKGIFIGAVRLLDLIEGFTSYRFITKKYSAMKKREINIYPIWIFRVCVEESTVFYDRCIYWILKAVRKTFHAKFLVTSFWKFDVKVSPFL